MRCKISLNGGNGKKKAVQTHCSGKIVTLKWKKIVNEKSFEIETLCVDEDEHVKYSPTFKN